MTAIRARADVVVLAIAAVALRIAFWAWTGRIWEDALITVAHAPNAVDGLGLTHHVGEPVTHGFTSVLSVVIPVAGESVVRGSGIDALRISSLLAAVVTIAAADAIGRRLDLSRWARVLVMGYLAVDPNHIFYGMAGMETQVAVAALLVSAWTILAGRWWAGVALGVALLARPDLVLWGIAVGLVLIHRDRARLGRIVAGAALTVAPWVVFATLYYGSPVPNTIIAKAVGYTTFPAGADAVGWAGWALNQAVQHMPIVVRSFSPFLGDSLAFGAPVPSILSLGVGAMFLVLGAWGFWTRRRDPRWLPLTGFVVLYTTYRIILLPTAYFDWYAPPFTAIAIFGVAQLLDLLAVRPHRRRTLALAGIIVVALPIPWVFGVERQIQRSVEVDVRQRASEALGSRVRAGEGVISESAGYIGYYSRVTLFDYPGLTSPTALDVLRAIPPSDRNLYGFIDRLRSPWLVLRPAELELLRTLYPDAAAEYTEVERFGAGRSAIEWFGYRKITIDDAFVILKRHR